MEQVTNDDFDRFFLQIQKKLSLKRKNSGELTEYDFGMNFHIQIPDEFIKAEKDEAENVYRSIKRPSIIFFTEDKNEGITFQIVEEGNPDADPDVYRERIKNMIEQVDDRTVFYNTGSTGENVKSYWLEYKSFAAKERIYNLLFIFQAGGRTILGTFYCLFKDYDKWKPEIFEVLNTIRMEESVDERL